MFKDQMAAVLRETDNLDDRVDLREVFSLFNKGLYTKALDRAMELDTIVRDSIPDEVWEIMEKA